MLEALWDAAKEKYGNAGRGATKSSKRACGLWFKIRKKGKKDGPEAEFLHVGESVIYLRSLLWYSAVAGVAINARSNQGRIQVLLTH